MTDEDQAASLWSRYDLTEGVVREIRWANSFRDLQLELDYHWDFESDQPNPKGMQPVRLQLIGCIWVAFETNEKAIERNINLASEAFTIIGWRIDDEVPTFDHEPHLQEALAGGYHYLVLQSAHSPEKLWIQAICKDMSITRHQL